MKQGEECRDRKNGSRGVVLMERLLGACSRGFEELAVAYPKAAQSQYRLSDCLRLALSMFVLKFPSLGQFLTTAEAGLEESSAAVVRVARQRSKERARGNIQRECVINSVCGMDNVIDCTGDIESPGLGLKRRKKYD